MPNEIKIGDKVEVHITASETFEGIVKHMPCATGDCWHIEEQRFYGRFEKPVLHYVQTFAEIIKYP